MLNSLTCLGLAWRGLTWLYLNRRGYVSYYCAWAYQEKDALALALAFAVAFVFAGLDLAGLGLGWAKS